MDIFAAAGLKKPDISILSDDFLAEVRGLPQKNLAVELLRKLLNNEIKLRSKKFLIQSKSFAELLENSIRKYQNRAIETAQVIEELIQLAKDMRKADTRGKDLGLSQDEVAFYDALETNDSAVKALGDKNLKFIAQELVKTIREKSALTGTAKESVRAKLRVMVKRILRKYGLSARQTGKSNPDGIAAGGIVMCGLGRKFVIKSIAIPTAGRKRNNCKNMIANFDGLNTHLGNRAHPCRTQNICHQPANVVNKRSNAIQQRLTGLQKLRCSVSNSKCGWSSSARN